MNEKRVQLNGLCYRYIGGVLMGNETVRAMIHEQIEKLFGFYRWDKKGDRLREILGSLDEKKTIYLPVERWSDMNPDFFKHPDRNLVDDELKLMEKYAPKLAELLLKEFKLEI